MPVLVVAEIEYLQFEDLESWIAHWVDCFPFQVDLKLVEPMWVKPLKLLDFHEYLDCSEFSVPSILEFDWAGLSNNWKKDLEEK